MGFCCRKFWKLIRIQETRDLNPRQSRFLIAHRTQCSNCAKEEQAELQSLVFLRGNQFEFESAPELDARIVSALVLQQQKRGVVYWIPAAMGAVCAALAIMATLQIISRSEELQPFNVGGTEARRTIPATHEFPELSVKDKAVFNR